MMAMVAARYVLILRSLVALGSWFLVLIGSAVLLSP